MANYAIDYALTQEAPGLMWKPGKQPKSFVLPHFAFEQEKTDEARRKWLEKLGPDDSLFLEMGPTKHFALAAYRQGAKVFRVSGHVTHDARGDRPKSATKEVLYELANDQPDAFYSFTERSAEIAEVGETIRAYHMVQKQRKRAVQQLSSVRIDANLLDKTGEVDIEQTVWRKLADLAYFRGTLGERPDRLMPLLVGNFYEVIEKILYAELEKKLNKLPLYKQVFKPIPQCGPAIAALIIHYIQDIKFFDTAAQLKHYAKLHQLENGDCPKKTSGVQCTWNAKFGQAFYQFSVQTRSYGKKGEEDEDGKAVKPGNIWKLAYLHRLEYEQTKVLPADAEIVAKASEKMLGEVQRRRAQRWIAQKFCEHIFRQWKAFNAGPGYQYTPPDFECLHS